MTRPVIRRATGDDATACAAIVNGWIDDTDWMVRTVAPEALVDILRDGLPTREAYVIGDPVVGYISIEAEAAHIWGFYLARTGQGLGKALLDHVKTGRDFLKLNTHAVNTRAHRFYRREGFVETVAPWRGEDGIDEITMEWRR